MTDDEVANLVEAGWIPPPSMWIPPSGAIKKEVVLVWLLQDGEPFAHGVSEFAYLDDDNEWLDMEGRIIERSDYKVVAIAPAPYAGVDISPLADRLLRMYMTMERAGTLPAPSVDKKDSAL